MKLIKNNGTIEEFDWKKIKAAIDNCYVGLGYNHSPIPPFNETLSIAEEIALNVDYLMTQKEPRAESRHVNDVHDLVERCLIQHGEVEAARAYMRYRDEKRRKNGRTIPPEVREAFEQAKQYFPTPLQAFQYFDKYARWNDKNCRRETWPEAVQRVTDFLVYLVDEYGNGAKLEQIDIDQIHDAILNLRVLPSMRLLAMAGEAGKRDNITLYNCSFQGVSHPYAFVETLLISMAGCGVGYSVERKFVDNLPLVTESWEPFLDTFGEGVVATYTSSRVMEDPEEEYSPFFIFKSKSPNDYIYTHVIEDSTEGWANALATGLVYWFNGCDTIKFDYSEIRPAGARLKTKGGVASGPKPLRRMLDFIRDTILSARGRKLKPIEVHDIMCMIGECAVQGGMRRTAMIALFDFDDEEMRHCKDGQFWREDRTPWRQNANNSAVWPDRELSYEEIKDVFMVMDDGGSGEPGIFSRINTIGMMPSKRLRRLTSEELEKIGTNPCGEINLLDGEFCNLSIAVARPGLPFHELLEAQRIATIIGTIQSLATHFPGLRSKWKRNSELERLLGVDVAGHMDYGGLTEDECAALLEVSRYTNKCWAYEFGINPCAAGTCAKPSGNSSALLNCSPGINARWSPWQVRRATVDPNGPMYKVFRAAKAPMVSYGSKFQIEFPTAAPAGTQTTRDRSALDQLNYWKLIKLHYTEHNPSCTITYRKHEIQGIIDWLYENQSIIGGLSFLPASDHVYSQNAPNEEITENEYNERVKSFPDIDYAMLYAFEDYDQTTSAREVACSAGVCEVL